MKQYYSDKGEYLAQLKVVEDALNELWKFDAYNDDADNATYFNMTRDLETIKEKLVDQMNKQHFNWNDIDGINRTAEEMG